jgi:hypothetical protein
MRSIVTYAGDGRVDATSLAPLVAGPARARFNIGRLQQKPLIANPPSAASNVKEAGGRRLT